MVTTFNGPCRLFFAAQHNTDDNVAEWIFPKCAIFPLLKKDVSIGTDRSVGPGSYHLHVPHQEKCIMGRIRGGILETNTCSNFIVFRPHCKITNFTAVNYPARETYPSMCKLEINSKITLGVGDVVLMVRAPSAAGNMVFIEWFGFCFPDSHELLNIMQKLQKAMRIWREYIDCFNPATLNNSINPEKYAAFTCRREQFRDQFPLQDFKDYVPPAKKDDVPALPAKRKCEEVVVVDGK